MELSVRWKSVETLRAMLSAAQVFLKFMDQETGTEYYSKGQVAYIEFRYVNPSVALICSRVCPQFAGPFTFRMASGRKAKRPAPKELGSLYNPRSSISVLVR
jgi:hypothetical protein